MADIPGGDQHVCFLPKADIFRLLNNGISDRERARRKREAERFGSF